MRVGWKLCLKKNRRACSFIRELRVHNNCIQVPATIQNNAQETRISIFNLNAEVPPIAPPRG